jgi:hypothetical protein
MRNCTSDTRPRGRSSSARLSTWRQTGAVQLDMSVGLLFGRHQHHLLSNFKALLAIKFVFYSTEALLSTRAKASISLFLSLTLQRYMYANIVCSSRNVGTHPSRAADIHALLCVEERPQNRHAARCYLFYLFFEIFMISPLSGCYYLRTRAAVDAIKFTVDAAVAGMAFLLIFASAFVYFRPGNGAEGSAAKSKEQNMADMVRSVLSGAQLAELFLFLFDKRAVHRGAGLQLVQQGGMHSVQLLTAAMPFSITCATSHLERLIATIRHAQVTSCALILASFANERFPKRMSASIFRFTLRASTSFGLTCFFATQFLLEMRAEMQKTQKLPKREFSLLASGTG